MLSPVAYFIVGGCLQKAIFSLISLIVKLNEWAQNMNTRGGHNIPVQLTVQLRGYCLPVTISPFD